MHFCARVVAFVLLVIGRVHAASIVVDSRDIEFARGDVTLSGTVFAPTGAGTFPAMILMPGSGNETRSALLDLARSFAADGMVTLVYDKQGTGKSGGSWTKESLDDLAADGLAGIRWLRLQADVDPRNVGAWGISQSGWVLPRLAAQAPELAFLICVTGGGATPREVENFGYRNELLHSGFSETDWDAARRLVDRYMDYLASGKDRDGLLAAIESAQASKWSSVIRLARVVPDQADYAKWSWVATYDPAADIRVLHMPVLVLLGGRDPFAPSSIAIQRWQEGLAAAGNPHDLVVSYPAAGHGIRANGHDMHAAPEYAPGYLAGQFQWLHSIGVLH